MAGAFFAGAFFAAVFFAGVFFAGVFVAVVFLAVALLAGAFFVAFLAVFFSGARSRRSASSSDALFHRMNRRFPDSPAATRHVGPPREGERPTG